MAGEDGQSPLITRVLGLKSGVPDDSVKPVIVHIVTETSAGPLVLRMQQPAALELAAMLIKNFPQTRSSR